jgi:hypothetical protein
MFDLAVAPTMTIHDLTESMADELRRMIVRCNCGPTVPCEPCRTADRLLARYDGSAR